MSLDRPAPAGGSALRALWLAWLVFVVYGSLVPLEFKAVSLSAAWERFSQIRMLDVGLQGRADWVANGVLYVPLGVLSTLLFSGGRAGHRLPAGALALLLSVALALVVEFAQLFFPPRTVSLNDLLAETLGAVLGVVIAVLGMRYWHAALERWHGQRQLLVGAVLPLGLVALLLFSLFPFDLLISRAEWADKLAGGFCGWWIAPVYARDGGGLMLLRLLAESLVVVPLGAWWGRRWACQRGLTVAPDLVLSCAVRGGLLGAGFGVLLELGQLFVASGVSQGVSVLSRSAGWGLGAVLGVYSLAWDEATWRTLLRRWTVPVLVGWVLAAAVKAGWWSGAWSTADQAWARLTSGELRFLPFYYHYFTSEGAAVQSTVPVLLLFAPWGLLAWVWRRSPWVAGVGAGTVAAVMEAGRLFLPALRPDPTNALLAAASAATVAWLLHQLVVSRGPDLEGQQSGRLAQRKRPAPAMAAASLLDTAAARSPVLWITVVLSMVWLWRFPVYQAAVGTLLLGSAALVWWRPVLLLAVVVAALPLLNLTIWSGQEYADEFDVLVLLCVAVAWARRTPVLPRPALDDRLGAAVVLMVCMSLLASAIVGWAPWDLSSLANPHGPLSSWYSLRLFKGAVLAALVVALIRRQLAAGEPVRTALGVGMVVGLAGVLAWVLWERKVFVGLLNFAAEYRVAGPVLPMRLGGAYLDVFLVVSLPFALVGALHGRNIWWRTLCVLTALGAIYTMAVTFTRSTYLAVALAVAVVAVGALRPRAAAGSRRWWTAAALTGVLVAAAYPIVTGPFASARMAVVEQDMVTRLAHARHVVSVRDNDVVTHLVGQGLGRFPFRNFWEQQLSRGHSGGMGVHQFLPDESVSILQLGAGPRLYLDQAVSADLGTQVHIRTRVRSTGPGGKLVVGLCQKWLLASGTCASHSFFMPEAESDWRGLAAPLKTDEVNRSSGGLKRPVRLTIYNAGPTRLDIDAISVLDSQGRELVRNGGFDQGSDHWSYASDDHLAWHVKNMALAIWFDLGWVGVVAFGAFLLLALLRLARASWLGDRSAQAMLAALTGLMVVAMFDSVVDEPRYLLLLLLLLWLAAQSRSEAGRGVA